MHGFRRGDPDPDISDWLQKQQFECVSRIYFSHQQSVKHYYTCILEKTSPCIQDQANYQHNPISLAYHCGAIASENIEYSMVIWHIHSKSNIRLHVEDFSLHYFNWHCGDELMEIVSGPRVQEFCGKRLPWKQDLPGPDVSIRFHTELGTRYYYFRLYYHAILRWLNDKQVAFKPYRMGKIYSYYPEFKDNVLLKLHFINYYKLNILYILIWDIDTAVSVTCYDGPGTRSPILVAVPANENTKFKASTYQMYCVMSASQNYSHNSQYHLTFGHNGERSVFYKNSFKPMPVNESKLQTDFNLELDPHLTGNAIYSFEADEESYLRKLLLERNIFIYELTIYELRGLSSYLLLEHNECIYGGLYVLKHTGERKNEFNENTVWSLCDLGNFKDIPIDMTKGELVLFFIAYDGYTEGQVSIKGRLMLKLNHELILEEKALLYSVNIRNWTKRTILDLGRVNNMQFVMQPYLNARFPINYWLGFSEHDWSRSETFIYKFQYLNSEASCAVGYVKYASYMSRFINFPDGRIQIQPETSFRNDTKGRIETNVESVYVDQSKCKSPQLWKLYIKVLTGDDFDAALRVNRSYFMSLPVTFEEIWNYSEYSPLYKWFMLILLKPFVADALNIWTINLDLTCLITDVFVEHMINSSNSSLPTSTLYKWQNTTQMLWLSGCEYCNIILVSNPLKIPSSCDLSIRTVDMVLVKRYHTLSESLLKETNSLTPKELTYHGIRYGHFLCT